MSQLIHYTNCPVCGSSQISKVIIAKDFTVSGETFGIMECNSCSLRFTQDVPDAVSIAPYYKSENYISHTDTSKGLINRLYQFVRKRTLKRKRKLIQKATGIVKGNILDVGSGTGAFVREMKAAGWMVTGLEPDADARKLAAAVNGVTLTEMDQFYKLEPGTFDAITLWHVLEHVHDLQPYIVQLKRLLKENGKLFIAVPNYTSKDAGIYKEYWAAYDVPRHLYHFSPKSIQVLMEKQGLKLQQYLPMWYDSFYISMLSSKYKKGKTNLFTSFFNGLRSNFKAMNNTKRCSSVIYIVGK
ncbi:MAG: class I SAM-dependent methyltransferase [Chitinophagaceae bacterium]